MVEFKTYTADDAARASLVCEYANRNRRADSGSGQTGRAGTSRGRGRRELEGRERDLAADARDRAARRRDQQAELRDGLSDKLMNIANRAPVSSGHEVIVRAELDRQRAHQDRTLAAEDRARAAQDREHAARDRMRSAADRAAATGERQLADPDVLTGVLLSAPGLAVLARDIARAIRTNSPLTVVLIAIDDPTAVNGHDAHDSALLEVAGAVLSRVRPYDLVIGLHADQLVSALCGASIATALARFGALRQALAQAHKAITITIGYADLAAGDTPSTLIGSAHADLSA
jgi:GGDEF domain-containing protein